MAFFWFLYIGLGIGDTRYSLLLCEVAGWVWLRSETMGCGVVFH